MNKSRIVLFSGLLETISEPGVAQTGSESRAGKEAKQANPGDLSMRPDAVQRAVSPTKIGRPQIESTGGGITGM